MGFSFDLHHSTKPVVGDTAEKVLDFKVNPSSGTKLYW